MTMLDLQVIVQPILGVIGLIIAGLIASYVPRALSAFETRTGIQLTDQQHAMVLSAVKTAAGIVETKLDQGVLQVAHVNINNDTIREQAQAVINSVPDEAASLGITQETVARMIVGAADTSPHSAVPLGTAPVPITAAPLGTAAG